MVLLVQCLNILKAALTSDSALTNGLLCYIDPMLQIV